MSPREEKAGLIEARRRFAGTMQADAALSWRGCTFAAIAVMLPLYGNHRWGEGCGALVGVFLGGLGCMRLR